VEQDKNNGFRTAPQGLSPIGTHFRSWSDRAVNLHGAQVMLRFAASAAAQVHARLLARWRTRDEQATRW
jgi:hypothetical protein